MRAVEAMKVEECAQSMAADYSHFGNWGHGVGLPEQEKNGLAGLEYTLP